MIWADMVVGVLCRGEGMFSYQRSFADNFSSLDTVSLNCIEKRDGCLPLQTSRPRTGLVRSHALRDEAHEGRRNMTQLNFFSFLYCLADSDARNPR